MQKENILAKNSHCHDVSTHPSHEKSLPRLRRIQGQIEGISRMIEGRRYCPEILTQLRAAHSALRSLEAEILKTHLENCVKEALKSKNEKKAMEKIEEIVKLFSF